jgi:hypothetical protein
VHHGAHVVEEPDIAGEQAQVAQRHFKFGIRIRAGLLEVGQLPDVMADRQFQVPERLENGVDEAFFARADRPVEDDEQINVRVQAEGAAPVSAERRHDPGLARLARRPFGDASYEVVHLERIPGLRRAPATAREGLDAVDVARRGQVCGPLGTRLEPSAA